MINWTHCHRYYRPDLPRKGKMNWESGFKDIYDIFLKDQSLEFFPKVNSK